MKFKKVIFSGVLSAATIAPIASVVACGNPGTQGVVKSVSTQSYADSATKLLSDTITVTGGYNDIRDKGNNDQQTKIHVVGVEKARIANDGIQVKEGMKAGDQYALQQIFKALIVKSQTEAGLQVDIKGKTQSVFQIYSHSNYKETPEKVSILDGATAAEKSAYPDAANKPDENGAFEIFDADPNNVGGFKTKTGQTLKIVFIPSADAALVQKATTALKTYLNRNNITSEITVAGDYDTAAGQLKQKQYDVAFLPVDTWTKSGNSNFILQAARDLQLTALDLTGQEAKEAGATLPNEKDAITLFNRFGSLYVKDVTTDALSAQTLTPAQNEFKKALDVATDPLHDKAVKIQALADKNKAAPLSVGSYESFIYTKIDSNFDKKITEWNKQEGWKQKTSTIIEDAIYGFTSKTSSASYLFPQLWFKDHFEDFGGF